MHQKYLPAEDFYAWTDNWNIHSRKILELFDQARFKVLATIEGDDYEIIRLKTEGDTAAVTLQISCDSNTLTWLTWSTVQKSSLFENGIEDVKN